MPTSTTTKAITKLGSRDGSTLVVGKSGEWFNRYLGSLRAKGWELNGTPMVNSSEWAALESLMGMLSDDSLVVVLRPKRTNTAAP